MADIKTAIADAKSKLQETPCDGSTQSTYDVLSKLIRNLLDERPANAVDKLGQIIEKVSLSVAEESTGEASDEGEKESPFGTVEQQAAELEKVLFDGEGADDIGEDEEDETHPLPDIQAISHGFAQAGVGLSDLEWTRIYLALQKLTVDEPISSCRFFGKMLGLHKNYYIAEIQYRDEEEYEEEEEEEEGEDQDNEEEEEDNEDEEEWQRLPKSQFKPPKKLPKEAPGAIGANKYIYFVCNVLGEKWVKLPNVRPEEIQLARKICKYFTGDLEAPVVGFPEFPGNETNLLRAQIARIAAGTVIAPFGYFMFEGEEEDMDEEEMGLRNEAIENPEFTGVPIGDLTDPRMAQWVHARLHINKQGRCVWFNPRGEEEEEEEGDDLSDDGAGLGNLRPEASPDLLTQLSDDKELAGLLPWSTRAGSGVAHSTHTVALVKSNLWPGAVAYCDGKNFENVYIGFGVKFQPGDYSPAPPQPFEFECEGSPPTEVDDPTLEEEAALRETQQLDAGEEEEGDGYED